MSHKKGDRFNKLKLLYKTKKTRQGQYWQCLCECGLQKEVRIDHLKSGATKSCGCLLKGKTSVHYKGYENIPKSFFSNILYNAQQRGIPVEIGIEYLHDLFQKQNGLCALSGKELSIPRLKSKIGAGNASLDRIDSSLGYIKGNVWFIDKTLNVIKNNLSLNKFLYYCCCILHPVDIASDSVDLFHKNKGWDGVGNISGSYISKVKKGARKKDIEYNVDNFDLWNIFKKQGGKCAITGLPIYFCNKNNLRNQTASLDRIDSNLPYSKYNIQWLHKDVNKIKWSLSFSELHSWSETIVHYRNLQEFKPKVWGLTRKVFSNSNSEIHYFEPFAGGYCSIHKHKEKWNRFFVISGVLKINIFDKNHRTISENIISDNQIYDVSPGTWHQFETLEDTRGIEIYWTNDLVLEDIERVMVGGISINPLNHEQTK